jgi:hypothetical protein
MSHTNLTAGRRSALILDLLDASFHEIWFRLAVFLLQFEIWGVAGPMNDTPICVRRFAFLLLSKCLASSVSGDASLFR